jgi:hypothetical protein
MNKTIEQMNIINKLYETNYKKYIVKDISTLTNKITNIDKLRINLMMKKTFKYLDNVEIRKSKIHGNGVFAKKDIEESDLITFYPVDILQLYIGNDESTLRFSNKYIDSNRSDSYNIFNNLKSYKFNCNNRNAIIGDPRFIDNANYLGHMINDSMNHNKSKKSRNLYKNSSQKKSNCNFHNMTPYELFVPIIANKNIKKDEELFVSYGVQYWDNI